MAMNSRNLKVAKKISNAAFWVLTIAAVFVMQDPRDHWGLAAALVGGAALALAAYLGLLWLSQAQAQRELAQFVQHGAAWTELPVVLFLRSFAVARSSLGGRLFGVVTALNGPSRFDVEEKLDDAVGAHGMLVAIGDKFASYGSAKLIVDDRDWQQTFSRLAGAARLIVMMPGPSASVLWELAQILGSAELLPKTIFVMPRALDDGKSEGKAWAEFVNAARSALNVRFPAYQITGCYLRLRPADRSWEVAYLEPFTHHLARSLKQQPDFDVAAVFKRAA